MVSVAKQWRRPINAIGGQEEEKKRSRKGRKGQALGMIGDSPALLAPFTYKQKILQNDQGSKVTE
jgi:hypothetical protein